MARRRLHIVGVERERRRQQCVEDDATGPHVALARVVACVACTAQQLGRRVERRAAVGFARAERLEIAQPKVGNLQLETFPFGTAVGGAI